MRTGLLTVIVLALCSTAPALTVDVYPGPGALQSAIDAANAGDTLRLHQDLVTGTYPEVITIDKRLRLIGEVGHHVSIRATCTTLAAVTVTADHVVIQNIRVSGGTLYAIDVQNRDRVAVKQGLVEPICGTEQYGIHVYQSTNVTILRNEFRGRFTGAAVYAGGINAGARIRVVKNDIGGNAGGVVLEDSMPPIIVRQNTILFNDTGILLRNSDGAVIGHNRVDYGVGYGIHADSTSDDNFFVGNEILQNGVDVVDEGSSNCWRGNQFETGTPNPNGC